MTYIGASTAKGYSRTTTVSPILIVVLFSARTDASRRLNNHPMKRPPLISKRCERCNELFSIPNIRESRARELILQFYPCPHCLYVPNIHYPRYNRSGRCRDCSIPFSLVDHHANGRCKRCDMIALRHEKGGT